MKRLVLASVAVGLALAGLACGNSTPAQPDGGAPKAGVAPPVRGGAAAASASASAMPPTVVMEFAENDFTESDHSRDPFRSFAGMFIEDRSKPHARQVEVVLGQYSIDELKLVAIVQSGDYPRAMLVDPTTKGWVVKRGDYIGRPDTVHTGGGTGGTDYQVNWRVDRIRDGDIVLTREDPAQPGQPPATRSYRCTPRVKRRVRSPTESASEEARERDLGTPLARVSTGQVEKLRSLATRPAGLSLTAAAPGAAVSLNAERATATDDAKARAACASLVESFAEPLAELAIAATMGLADSNEVARRPVTVG